MFEDVLAIVCCLQTCARGLKMSPGLGFCLWIVFEGLTDYVLSADVCERFENVSVVRFLSVDSV